MDGSGIWSMTGRLALDFVPASGETRARFMALSGVAPAPSTRDMLQFNITHVPTRRPANKVRRSACRRCTFMTNQIQTPLAALIPQEKSSYAGLTPDNAARIETTA